MDDFRSTAHRVADWIAEYLEHPDRYPVLPRVKPGDIRAALPDAAPRTGESFDDPRGLRAGHRSRADALEPPRVLRLLCHQHERPRRHRRIPVGGAESAGDALA